MTAADQRLQGLSILADRVKRQIPDRNHPFFAALASETNDSVRLIEVTEIDPHDLTDSGTGRVHRFQQGTIA
jgi:hypothetical protein